MKNISSHPLPPENFNDRPLPISEYNCTWYRLNPASFSSAIFFDRSGRGRFDSPQASYGILYVAQEERGAFIETMGRALGVRTVSQIALQRRNLFEIESDRPLLIVDLWGVNLSKMGMDARISSGNYEIARAWAEAIYNHPQKVNGISYHSRHDDIEICGGLFDRTATILKETNTGNLLDCHGRLLAEILQYYDYSLI